MVQGKRTILLVIVEGDLWFNLHQFTHDGAVAYECGAGELAHSTTVLPNCPFVLAVNETIKFNGHVNSACPCSHFLFK